MWKKLKDFLTRDVKNENEVKMYSVIMRLNLIVFALYCIISLSYSGITGRYGYMAYGIVCLILSAVLFAATYFNCTRCSATGAWIMFCSLLFVQSMFFGTDTGVSQIMYILIIITFTLDYMSKKIYKVLVLGLLAAYRLALYIYFSHNASIYGINHDANEFWKILHLITFATMVIATVTISTSDFTDMRRKLTNTNARFRDLAGRDALTGLYNRRVVTVFIKEQIEAYAKKSIDALTVVMADVDCFKRFNDTYGHDNGDEVLVAIGNIMGAFMRGRGIPSRWGGEEFVLVFVGKNGDEVYELIYELRKKIANQKFNFNGDEVTVTLTFGVSEVGNGMQMEDAIKEADEKMYIGKERGRNAVIF